MTTGETVRVRHLRRGRCVSSAVALLVVGAALGLSAVALRSQRSSRATQAAGPSHAGSQASIEPKRNPQTAIEASSAAVPARTSSALAASSTSVDGDPALGELARGLRATSHADRIDAIEAAVERRAIQSLPLLQSLIPASDPEIAPSVIYAVARLGNIAPPATRDRAARTLADWLEQESGRAEDGARDARGNRAALVEALGVIGGPTAVDALMAALDGQRLPLHLETIAVQSLSELRDPRVLATVSRFAERIAALPEASGFEQQLRREAMASARAAQRESSAEY
jgi:HEAT repeat protein